MRNVSERIGEGLIAVTEREQWARQGKTREKINR